MSMKTNKPSTKILEEKAAIYVNLTRIFAENRRFARAICG
jgi:hypothetical protein